MCSVATARESSALQDNAGETPMDDPMDAEIDDEAEKNTDAAPTYGDVGELLAAAGVAGRAALFADEDVDLDCVLEASAAGDLMDLLKEIGLKATERMKIKRALNPPSRA